LGETRPPEVSFWAREGPACYVLYGLPDQRNAIAFLHQLFGADFSPYARKPPHFRHSLFTSLLGLCRVAEAGQFHTADSRWDILDGRLLYHFEACLHDFMDRTYLTARVQRAEDAGHLTPGRRTRPRHD
jgi:hypothetical protein